MANKETIEEAAERNSEKYHYAHGMQSEFYQMGFTEGGIWQQKQEKKLYTEEDMKKAFNAGSASHKDSVQTKPTFEEFIEKL